MNYGQFLKKIMKLLSTAKQI